LAHQDWQEPQLKPKLPGSSQTRMRAWAYV